MVGEDCMQIKLRSCALQSDLRNFFTVTFCAFDEWKIAQDYF
jgi:hypothetical protein